MVTPSRADALFDALRELREADEVDHPRYAGAWAAVSAYVAGLGARGDDDARQETLIAVVRYVRDLSAETPGEAASWVRTIHRRKRLDGLRRRARDPVARGLDEREGAAPRLDGVPSMPRLPVGPEAVDALLEHLLGHVTAALEESVPRASTRALKRTQAEAALLRLVREASAEELRAALALPGEVEKARLYKWVERGRAVVELGLDRWAREEGPGLEDVRSVLRARMRARRGDAGKARKARS